MSARISRRLVLGSPLGLAAAEAPWRLATFAADVTPAVGSPLFNSVPARRITDPLGARGFALSGAGGTFVVVAVDWCEIRNASYELWRKSLGEAAGTAPERVLMTCVHQHDAPYTDRRAQQLLAHARAEAPLCDVEFEDRTIRLVATALRESMRTLRPVSHVGTGMARVERIASNRRYVLPDGRVSFGRTSATRDPHVRERPEGLIDPWLRTLSLWDGSRPVVALTAYATHPMSYYGKGEVSTDFVGMARAARQAALPETLQIYTSGASGDTMAGRYNDGDPANRPVLAARLREAMERAWEATERFPLEALRFRKALLRFEPRRSPGFSADDLQRKLADASQTQRVRVDAALGLSWRERVATRPIDVPSIELAGAGRRAHLLLVPAETFVQYQLWAQEMRRDSFVVVTGFGECAPGYIPTAEAAKEGYDDSYSWIAFPECEAALRKAMAEALGTG